MKLRKGDMIPLFYQMLVDEIDDEGISPMHGLAEEADGSLSYLCLLMDGPNIGSETIKVCCKHVKAGATELIFGLDRFGKPGQGTELDDIVTVYYFNGRAWRFGVIEYEYVPNHDKIVRPINWQNAFWIDRMKRELSREMGSLMIHSRPPIVLPPRGKRPAGISQEEVDRRKKSAPEEGLDVWMKVFPGWPCDRAENDCAYDYLGKALTARGVETELVNRICFAAGQRISMNSDPWGTVQSILDRHAAGDVDKPGEALAEKLFKEAMPYFLEMYGPPDPAKLRDVAASIGDKVPVCPY